ncbi:tRNA(fMet)-specific endonuclease VapC [Candidatus Hakubella thermalkaliphila]|uniref:Ribonuclease VapC n=1 Tax=Candidatus Hakubella thermalkaliphila TaxID=2754717 RepID=A0A6V8NT98_9ACTN|nr:type II toxin-antitoxin system VapC family toxin [Candidatus Hakubella thermalkaliphila]MBT9169572.1 tRNA(fMet)-specific endonuclease VapC [Bacillota bacterium]GFP23327.1 tRNA(fMet)-specific endonuclease VapC [Candidatus Hakubella thermalkaliphila]GFP29641.1 tRNA(fMet)-specific endonuclease VapC [Candidatus Hakubella thermalkaliphila]GFP39307.1 tRNA(fMet)-specific endonuclease VapC [Candidatus Hakubella thermalkaliphila]GFP42643.1 tRNA(fMet)-specific endonuclease VapC [Candidatus Hakubella 
MGVICDTSLLIAAERGLLDVDDFVRGREEEPFGISVITVSELLHGVHRADTEKRRLKREAYVEKVIETFPIYLFDTATARIYARIWANLVRKGIQVGAHDLIIASTAIALGFSVATFDLRDYGKIEELTVEHMEMPARR